VSASVAPAHLLLKLLTHHPQHHRRQLMFGHQSVLQAFISGPRGLCRFRAAILSARSAVGPSARRTLRKEPGSAGMSAPVRLACGRCLIRAGLCLLTPVHLEDGSERLTGAVEKDDGARKLHAIELGVVRQVGGCLGDGVRQFER
jgi:hypothetical protein